MTLRGRSSGHNSLGRPGLSQECHLYTVADEASPPEAALLRFGRSFPMSGCFCGSRDGGFRLACKVAET